MCQARTRQKRSPFTAASSSVLPRGFRTELVSEVDAVVRLQARAGMEGRLVGVPIIWFDGSREGMQEGCEVPAVEEDEQGTPGGPREVQAGE